MSHTFTENLSDGSVIRVRPINRDDVERERAFVDGLSTEARRFRFLGGIGHLSESQLKRFCDIDLKHEMAFVALVQGKAGDTQVGVAPYVADAGKDEAEIAISVADKYMSKGSTSCCSITLTDCCPRFAKWRANRRGPYAPGHAIYPVRVTLRS
jgi:hypothetical protein